MTSVPHPLDPLAEEFVARLRNGERPSLTEYAERHPELAEQIRALFPTLLVMEQAVGQQTMPERLGEYRILRELGRGGMGIVYEAVQEPLGRHVALKVLPAHVQLDPLLLERFQREASAAARLQHAHIVPVYGVGQQHGVHYYAMQYVAGRALDQVLSVARARSNTPPCDETPPTGALPSPAAGAGAVPAAVDAPFRMAEPGTPAYFRQVAQLGVEAADALAYAHRQGVLHRDIKPANLMLDRQGSIWIADFGLAKAEGLPELTQTGDIVGTLRYMAPEQFNGNAETRSDLYSLGLTLYELLTLRPAFDEQDRAKLIKQVTLEEPPRPRSIQPSLPRDLETVVLKAIVREPERRYQTGADLAADLRRFLADEPVAARRSTLWERGWRWGRRNPALAALVTSVAVLLLVVAVGSSLAMVYLSATLAESETRRERAEAAERQEAAKLFEAYLGQVRAARVSGQPGQRLRSLEILKEAIELARKWHMPPEKYLELRNEAIACLALTDMVPQREWQGSPLAHNYNAVFSGNLEYCAWPNSAGTISVFRCGEDRELARLPSPAGGVGGILFSPNGETLFASYWGKTNQLQIEQYRVWDWRRGIAIFECASPPEYCAAFNSDGALLALGNKADGSIGIYQVSTGMAVRTLDPIGNTVRPSLLAFDPSDTRLAVFTGPKTTSISVSEDRTLEVRELATNRLVHRWPTKTMLLRLAWHPDGSLLAGAGTDSQIYLWDQSTGVSPPVLRGHRDLVESLGFSPTGNWLVSYSIEGNGRLWNPWTGDCLVTFPTSGLRNFRPRQDRLVSRIGHGFTEWAIVSGKAYRTIASQINYTTTRYQSLSSDGRWLILSSSARTRLWDLENGKQCDGIPKEWTETAIFHPSEHALYMRARSRVQRWPFHLAEGVLRIGPPDFSVEDRLPSLPGMDVRDHLLATVARSGIQVQYLGDAFANVPFMPHPNVIQAVIGPNGRWITSSGARSSGVKVWELPSGKLVRHLQPDEHEKTVRWSPDGLWLLSEDPTGYTLWEAASWQAVWRIPLERPTGRSGSSSFTADGRILALLVAPDAIHLTDPTTGRMFARLQVPYGGQLDWIHFVPDGGRLVVGTRRLSIPHVWDLRYIRSRLAEMGLDWDAPPYPPAKWTADTPPVRVEVLGAQ